MYNKDTHTHPKLNDIYLFWQNGDTFFIDMSKTLHEWFIIYLLYLKKKKKLLSKKPEWQNCHTELMSSYKIKVARRKMTRSYGVTRWCCVTRVYFQRG